MAYLIDGTTELPENGDTGWGTVLNAAINSIDNRFTWVSSEAVAKKAAASGITGSTLASNVVSSSLTSVGTLGSLAVTGNVTIGGDLTINGDSTTINTATLSVEDNIVILNSGVTGSPTLDAGIEVERGTETNAKIYWSESGTGGQWRISGITPEAASFDTDILNGLSLLNDLGNVSYESASTGDFLKYDGSNWVSSTIALGTNTTGNYVADVTAGTGVTVTHTPGEGSSAQVAIGQAIGTGDSPQFTNLTLTGALTVTGATVLGPSVITQQSTGYTLALTDAGDIVEFTNGAANVTVTVPPESSVNFPVGTQVTVIRNGSGTVQFAAGAGVTIFSDASKQFISTQYSAATLIKRAADEWYLVGNLSAS